MQPNRRKILALAASFALTLSAGQALAKGVVVRVSLWEKSATSMDMQAKAPAQGMKMANAGTAESMGPMGIALSTHTVRAGKVTFDVTNTSKMKVHEMVLSAIKSDTDTLPYDKTTQRVDEEAAGRLGAVALEPGKNASLTIDLKPGKYIVYCNVVSHYVLGMWAQITVT